MKYLFGGVLALFLILYSVALLTRDHKEQPGITSIRWCTDANPARTVQIAAFTRLNPTIEVVLDPGARQKLIVQCATGTGPDVIDMFNREEMVDYVASGIVLDLTEIARAKGFATENTYPAVREALTVEGRQYRFPCNVGAYGVIYNRAIFDDHGVPYPDENWTYEQFVAAGRRILDTPSKSGEKHIPVANWNSRLFFLDLLVGNGGQFFQDHGTRSALDSPEAIEAMRMYHALMHEEHVLTTPAEASAMGSQGGWGAGGINWFSAERAAMIFIGRWYLCQAPGYPALKGKLGAARLPRIGNRASTGLCGARAAGINIKSRHRAEAVKFLQYLATSEYGELIVRDGDSLPPNPALAQTGNALTNAFVGDPAFHQIFIDAVNAGRVLDSSPFISPTQVMRWLDERIGLVENQRLTPEAAMRSLAKEVNETIRGSLERRPDLQRKYQKVTGNAYRSDWWK
ncbi:MAG: sugar ABC transporter substrate-binding protein [Planctomycetes bacterium]|nr:sugar ABC transporter substrate-binding protein [Planctomycetota bacterium]